MDQNGITDTDVFTDRHAEGWRSAALRIVQILFEGYRGPVAIKLWDGSFALGNRQNACMVTFHDPAALRELILQRDPVRVAEAYLDGRVDIEGDVETVFEQLDFFQRRAGQLTRREWLVLAFNAFKLPARSHIDDFQRLRAGAGAQVNSRAAISHHYDVGNAFYRLFLDPQMVYSCAYFRARDETLAQAQCNKLDLLCRKLRLQPKEKLLDIGCGWGALVLWAARHYGVEAHGITLSEEQFKAAQKRILESGLQDQVTVELRDYRDLKPQPMYDKVVSVGMFEHIGPAAYPGYFDLIKSVLKPGGLVCNHGIVNDSGWSDTPVRRFLGKYVFPDGALARISDVITAMENAGFEILDAESLRRHYALTLRRWINNLQNNHDEVVKLVGEPTYRVWRLYMSGSAHYFTQGGTNIFQVLAGHARQPLQIPLTREDIYANSPEV